MPDDGKVVYKIVADDSGIDKQLDQSEKTIQTKTSAWEKISSGALNRIGSLATDMAAKAAGAVIQYGSQFEQSLANASTLIDTNVTDMDHLKESILDLSDSSGVAADELNNALYSALSAGIPATEDMSEALDFLDESTKLAKAGFTDINTVVESTAKVLNAYGMDVSETDRVHKVLMQTQNLGITTVGELGSVLAQVTPTAAAFGVSFEQIGASLATMTAQGTPAAQATTQLNSLFSELGKAGTMAADNLAAAAANTEYAGMSFQDMMAAGVPLNEVLGLMGDYASENGLSMLDMFSSIEAGKAALSMTGEASQTFTDNLAAMSTQTDVVGEAYDKVTSTSGASFNEMLNRLKNAAIEVFEAFMPVLEEALPVFADLLEMLLPVLTIAGELIASLAKILVENLKIAFDNLSPVIQAFQGILQGLLDFINGVFAGNWSQAWNGIKKMFGSAFEGMKALFKAPINWIIDGLNKFIGYVNKIKIPDWVPGVGGKGINLSKIPRLQKGEDYVMDDWTPAFLDRGERVLTAAENQKYTAFGGIDGMERAISGSVGGTVTDMSGVMTMLAALLAAVQEGKVLTVGRQTFASLVAKANRSQSRATGWDISL